MQRFQYITPKTVEEACAFMAKGGTQPVAGGTDVIPRMLHNGLSVESLMDLSGLTGLRFIRAEGNQILLGALTTHTDLIRSALVHESADVLAQAAGTVGAHQTRNRGTLGGNIANASPAGDTLPALLALNAVVTLVSAAGERTLPLAQFLLGPGKIALRPGELIRQVSFERLPANARCAYEKMGKRNGMAIAIASAAAVVIPAADGTVKELRLALGSVASTPIRCPQAEAALRGVELTDATITTASQFAMKICSPISDIRSTAEYRREAVGVLVQHALGALREA